jgi:hypothetical protein
MVCSGWTNPAQSLEEKIGRYGVSDNEPKAGFAAWWMVGVLMLFYILSVFDRNIIYQMV